MNDRERITRLEIRCEQLQLTVNEAFHWIDILKSDLSDLQDRVGQADRKTENSSEKPNNCEDEPTWEQVKEYCNKRCLDIVDSALRKKWYKDEPQTCSVNGRPYDCGNCECFRCTADEPQTERSSE